MSYQTIAHQIIDTWNTKDLDQLAALYGEEIPFFDPLLDREIKGEHLLKYAQGIYDAFPDLVFKVKKVASGPSVAMVEWVQCGHNTGPIMGKPATNRYIEVPAVSVLSFAEDTFIGQRDYWDLQLLTKALFA